VAFSIHAVARGGKQMMRKQLMCAMAIAACGVIAAGCGPKKEETVAPPSMRGPAVIQEPAAVTPPGDSMAARVNGTVITHAEVDRALGEILQLVGGRISPEQMAGMRHIAATGARDPDQPTADPR
jgi:hypothetical protein